MASERLTIRLSPEAYAIVGEGEGLSRRINDLAVRYGEIVTRCLPTLTHGQWCAVLDALNGTLLEADTIAMLWMDIEDTPGLGEKWNIDQPLLVKTLQCLGYAELVAIATTVERYWGLISSGIVSDRAMALLGLPTEV